MTNLVTRNGRPNVIRGGIAKQFGPGLFYMSGRTHAAGGIDIGKNPGTGVEVENGEVVQLDNNSSGFGNIFAKGGDAGTMRVFSSLPFLTGDFGKVSPAQLVLNGADPDIVFAAQENFKDRFGINDDGTMKAKWGKDLRKRWHNTIDPTQGYPTGVSDVMKNVLRGAASLSPFYSPRFRVNPNDKVADAAWAKRLGIDYNEEDLPSNDDGSVRLPKQIELEIPTDTIMLKNRIRSNEKLAETLYGDDWKAVNNLINIDKKALKGLRHTYKTGEPVVINEFSHNSRNMYKNGKVDIKETPLNVLQNFTIQYDKNNNRMNYKDTYDFNQYEWLVPGKPFNVKGYIDLNKKKMGGIHIDKNKRGTFTAAATKHGMGVQEFASRVLANKEDYSPAMVKKANFARNASRWKKPAGGIVSVNGNVKNGLVYTGRTKAPYGLGRGLYAEPSIYGVYSTNKPAFTMLGIRPGWSHTYREPVNPLTDFVVPRIDLAELQQSRTPVRNNTNNRVASNSANNTITPNTVNVYGIGLDGKPVLQGTREVPQWIGRGIDDTPLNVFDNFTNVNGRGVQNNLVTVGNRQLSTSPTIPTTLPGVKRVQAAVQQGQSVPDTTGGGFNLTDPAIIGAGANILGSIGSYLINRNILNESEPKPTNVRLTAQKLRTNYNINPQLDELREQAAANNRLIANNSPSTRLSVARRNLINTNLARDIAKLYGIKTDKETELVNQDTLNSQGVGNQESVYNAQLEQNDKNISNENNRLRLANNSAFFSGLTGGINSIADSLLRQRYYNNTIGAIGARNPNVDARIFRDAGVDWRFMYPYSTRNRS